MSLPYPIPLDRQRDTNRIEYNGPVYTLYTTIYKIVISILYAHRTQKSQRLKEYNLIP